VCEKHCVDEVKFFRHIHKYHPDYWRVFSGGRPLTDFIEMTEEEEEEEEEDNNESSETAWSTESGGTSTVVRQRREKRYVCTVCGKTYSHESGYVKHMQLHTVPGGGADRPSYMEQMGGGGGGG